MRERLLRAVLAPLLCAALIIGAFPMAAGEAAYQKFSYIFFGTFDTAITLIGYARDKATFDRAAARTEALFNRLHAQFDRYKPYQGVNNLYTLNNEAAKGPVRVPEELFSLLKWCREQQDVAKGYVNIALGSVLRLWHDERDNAEADPLAAKLPDMDLLRAAAEHTDFNGVVLDEAAGTVYFRDPLLQLDVGAVAKGYAAEIAAQELLLGEMPNFILNAGGNVRAGLPPADGRAKWGVAIQDPDAQTAFFSGSETLDVLYVADASVVTSGDYQRFYTVDGKRYHHLIDPFTLMPGGEARSVTIVTRDSGFADLLSTAVFLMPYAEGRAFVESLPGVEALWVLHGGSIEMTDGIAAVAHSQGATPQ